MTRNAKIARLPRPLRDQLNRRLSANEDGDAILDWLNAAPNVKDLLASDFVGEPVSQQNLQEWRQSGFVEWQTRQDLFAEAADLTDANGEWDALAANDFTERLAAVLVVRYANALAGWNGGDDEAFRLKLRDLRRFNQDLAVLRRYNQSAARLKMAQMPCYQEGQPRTKAATSARKQSEAGARADDERVAQWQRQAQSTLTAVSAVPAASPANPTNSTSAAINVVDVAASPRFESGSGKELPTRDAANGAPAGLQSSVRPGFGSNQVKPMAPEFRPSFDRSPATDSPTREVTPVAAAPRNAADQSHAGTCAAGKSMDFGPTTLATGLIRANLVVEFAASLSNALTVIKEKSVHASDLKDRRAVQSAYAGSVATVNRLGQEAGLLRAELPGFAGVDRVYAAVDVLQREYLRMKSNLFQGCSAAIAVGIPQLRDAACELRENLQRTAANAASLAA